MTIAAWAQGWATIAGTRATRAGAHLGARTLLATSDVTGWTGPIPDRVLYAPSDPRPIDTRTAEDLHGGTYALDSGGLVRVPPGVAPWHAAPGNARWRECLNGFTWMRHLSTLGPDLAGEHARWLISSWIYECNDWDPVAWAPQVIARRLSSWLCHHRMVLKGSDLIWRSAFFRSIARQSHHLHQAVSLAADGEPKLVGAMGLALTGLCLPHGRRRLESGLALTLDALDQQILPDGGHISRNPAVLARLFLDLMTLTRALDHFHTDRPEALQRALDRMGPMVRFFRHGDGCPAAFNGGHRLVRREMDAALAMNEGEGQPLWRAVQSGYQRIKRGDVVVIMDTGTPNIGNPAVEAHAGCLSFEMSAGAERIIVNCGATDRHGPGWRHVLRATAAHSTVTVGDTSSCSFLALDASGKWGDGRVIIGPSDVPTERSDREPGTLLEASHDGYGRRFGLIHRRRIYVSEGGTDLRGEDMLARIQDMPRRFRRKGLSFAVRFHLHPDVDPHLSADGKSIHLALPSGRGWRFRAAGGALALEESPYIDEQDRLRVSRQMVVHARVEGHTTVIRWVVQGDDPLVHPITEDLEDEMPPIHDPTPVWARPDPDVIHPHDALAPSFLAKQIQRPAVDPPHRPQRTEPPLSAVRSSKKRHRALTARRPERVH